MKKFFYLLMACVTAFSFTGCNDDDDNGGNSGGNGDGENREIVDPVVLSYDKFLTPEDVKIMSADTAIIHVNKEYLGANGINIPTNHEKVPLVVWQKATSIPFVRNIVGVKDLGETLQLETVYGDIGDVLADGSYVLNSDLYVDPLAAPTIMGSNGQPMINAERYIDDKGEYHPVAYIVHDDLAVADEEGSFLLQDFEAKTIFAEDLVDQDADFKIINVNKDISDIDIALTKKEDPVQAKLYAHENHIRAIAGFRLGVDIGFFKLKKLQFSVFGDFGVKSTLGVNISKTFEKSQEKKLVSFGTVTTVFAVGPIPVAVTSEAGLKANAKFKVTAQADVSTTLDCYANFEIGAKYQDKKWSKIATGNAGSNTKMNVKAECDIKAELGVGAYIYANLKLYGCVGPEFALGPKVNGSAQGKIHSEIVGEKTSAYLEGSYSLGAAIGGDVSAKVSIWTWDLAKWSYSFTLWEGPKYEKTFRYDF